MQKMPGESITLEALGELSHWDLIVAQERPGMDLDRMLAINSGALVALLMVIAFVLREKLSLSCL